MAAKMWVFNANTNTWQSLVGGGAAGGDHSQLINLDKDDHLHYLTYGRADAKYALIEHLHDWGTPGEIYLRPANVRAGSSDLLITDSGTGVVTISYVGSGSGGSGGGLDEVVVSTEEPTTNPEAELWVDTDSPGTFRTISSTTGVTDHGQLTGTYPDDDHQQYVLVDGGRAMTGPLTLTGVIGDFRRAPTSGPAQVRSESLNSSAWFETRSPSGQAQGFSLRSYDKSRWTIGTDATLEGGGANGGTNLRITRFADNGSELGAVLNISRATGEITVAGPPVSAQGVATKAYADSRVVNSVTGPTPQVIAPSQESIKNYVDSKMIVSDYGPTGANYPLNTVWVEY